METINIVLLLAGAFLVGFGVVAAFATAFFYAVRLVGRERQYSVSRRDYFAAHAPAMPDWFKEMDELKGLLDLPTTAFFTWPWFYAKHMTDDKDR